MLFIKSTFQHISVFANIFPGLFLLLEVSKKVMAPLRNIYKIAFY